MSDTRGLDAAIIVAEHLPREEDGTATIMEVAQRRDVLLGYLQEAKAERDRYRKAFEMTEALVREMLADEPVRRRWGNRALDLIDRHREALDG
jgi:hypothetical protein